MVLGISLHLDTYVTTKMFAVAGMLAPDGRCKTLDGGADGYVRGEAGGAVQISGLSIGEGGGCSGGMGAVLRGCAVNQDGRSSALTAPNGPAQQDAIRAAMRDARVRDASTVTGLQMHGTGTPLGDPIEVGAATAVLTSKPGGVAITLSASKTFIGHTEPAAGIVGVMAAASTLAVPHAPAILHLRDMNPHVRVVLSMGGACACLAPPRVECESGGTYDRRELVRLPGHECARAGRSARRRRSRGGGYHPPSARRVPCRSTLGHAHVTSDARVRRRR